VASFRLSVYFCSPLTSRSVQNIGLPFRRLLLLWLLLLLIAVSG
jgi:hypothetical protein